ncbi:hypothetical protein KVP09_12055 [Alcaligenaceae bacterium CGII-47]|nr:hypothetical protein [Alcaligenaceae bacterium CGII-47]
MLAVYFGVNTTYSLIGLGLILLLALVLGIQAHRERILGGNEELLGMSGEVTQASDSRGRAYALVRSEIWRVHCAQPLSIGDTITVQAAPGLTLEVVRSGVGSTTQNEGKS